MRAHGQASHESSFTLYLSFHQLSVCNFLRVVNTEAVIVLLQKRLPLMVIDLIVDGILLIDLGALKGVINAARCLSAFFRLLMVGLLLIGLATFKAIADIILET